MENVMFEAANPQVFESWIKNYGVDVNLFIDHSRLFTLSGCVETSEAENHHLAELPGIGNTETRPPDIKIIVLKTKARSQFYPLDADWTVAFPNPPANARRLG